MKILKEIVRKLNNGEDIIEYSLINKNNFTVKILNYGGIITEILTPDKENNFENIVLGFENIKDYEENAPYFGCIVGRVAGRICNAKFEIDDNEYTLSKNNGNNNIHGGVKGFNKVIWDVVEIVEEDYIGLQMSYLSKDKEEGFPGNLNTKVIYILNNTDELEIKYEAVSDKKTIVNMTNHTYFNLSGDLKEDVLNHKLSINADKVAYLNEEIIPTGELLSVENTVFDFRKPKKLGEDIKKEVNQLVICGGYDHPFILNKDEEFTIKLEDENSGRAMEITTDQPVVVFYSGNFIGEDLILKQNKKSKNNLGLCLETQDYPDAVNQKSFSSKIYAEGEKYKAYTKYKFYLTN